MYSLFVILCVNFTTLLRWWFNFEIFHFFQRFCFGLRFHRWYTIINIYLTKMPFLDRCLRLCAAVILLIFLTWIFITLLWRCFFHIFKFQILFNLCRHFSYFGQLCFFLLIAWLFCNFDFNFFVCFFYFYNFKF